MKTLILGGARSGKSQLAEKLASRSHTSVIYIATANSSQSDDEMARRIQRHRSQRPDDWLTVEMPVELSRALMEHSQTRGCVIVDCLTLWVSNCLLDDETETWWQERKKLLACLDNLPGELILVSNEVGCGVVPMGEVNRRFVDEVGFLHQDLAKKCERIIHTIAGLPQILKGPGLDEPVL